MSPDTVKLLAGPLLALIPIFVWELAVKPRRTARNTARVLIAELQVNLDELAYYRVYRDDDRNAILVNLALPRASFGAMHSALGELPDTCMLALIRFYGVTAKLEATHVALESVRKRVNEATAPERIADLEASLDAGLSVLDSYIDRAWELGDVARVALHASLFDSWADDPAPLVSAVRIIEAAKERRAGRRPG